MDTTLGRQEDQADYYKQTAILESHKVLRMLITPRHRSSQCPSKPREYLMIVDGNSASFFSYFVFSLPQNIALTF